MSHYRIERLLGVGGMGMVYEACWLLPYGASMPVACKVMRDDRRHIPHYRDFIRQEAATSMRLGHNHPNLVTVFNFFEDGEQRPCLVMELVEGGSVADLLDAYHRLPFSIVRRIAIDALSALACLHDAQVLHRDLSPCNILVSTAGGVKVSDLNLVKPMDEGQAHTHTFRGKPVYASPEALERAPLDARSDLYSLGVILYEMLAGKPPWGEERDPDRILARSKREVFPPLPGSTQQDLVALIMGLLRSQPDARKPQSAHEAVAFLRCSGEPIAEPADLSRLVTTTVMEQRKAERRARGMAEAQFLGVLKSGDVLVAGPVDVPESTGHERAAIPAARSAHRSSSATTEDYAHSVEVKPSRRGTQSMASLSSFSGSRRSGRGLGGRAMRFVALLIAFMVAGATLGALVHEWLPAGDGRVSTLPVPSHEAPAEPPPGQEQRATDVPAPPTRAHEVARHERQAWPARRRQVAGKSSHSSTARRKPSPHVVPDAKIIEIE